jgi:hypothetical protein
MTDYADIAKANALVAEQASLADAVAILDNGGTLSTFIVVPALPSGDPEVMTMEEAIPQIPVAITTVAPPQALLDEARAAMVLRYNDIGAELSALGVSALPTSL